MIPADPDPARLVPNASREETTGLLHHIWRMSAIIRTELSIRPIHRMPR